VLAQDEHDDRWFSNQPRLRKGVTALMPDDEMIQQPNPQRVQGVL